MEVTYFHQLTGVVSLQILLAIGLSRRFLLVKELRASPRTWNLSEFLAAMVLVGAWVIFPMSPA
jgi:hypothetical protein